jgi:hypothetical protein
VPANTQESLPYGTLTIIGALTRGDRWSRNEPTVGDGSGDRFVRHRRSLRQFGALLALVCTTALAFGAAPTFAAAPASERSPTVLWEEYPLEPLGGPGLKKSVPSFRQAAAAEGSSTNWTLLAGGLALVVLALTDTVFLALSSRVLRDTA